MFPQLKIQRTGHHAFWHCTSNTACLLAYIDTNSPRFVVSSLLKFVQVFYIHPVFLPIAMKYQDTVIPRLTSDPANEFFG